MTHRKRKFILPTTSRSAHRSVTLNYFFWNFKKFSESESDAEMLSENEIILNDKLINYLDRDNANCVQYGRVIAFLDTFFLRYRSSLSVISFFAKAFPGFFPSLAQAQPCIVSFWHLNYYVNVSCRHHNFCVDIKFQNQRTASQSNKRAKTIDLPIYRMAPKALMFF